MHINEMTDLVHEQAVKAGWWEGKERSPLEVHMLLVTEVAEATEEVRQDSPPIYGVGPTGTKSTDLMAIKEFNVKPEGEAIELADVVIRIMDYFGRKKWDLEAVLQLKHRYNKTRSHRHGGKAY